MRLRLSTGEERRLTEAGALLPIGAPFFPGVTPIPIAQYAQGAVRDDETGQALHGDPIDA